MLSPAGKKRANLDKFLENPKYYSFLSVPGSICRHLQLFHKTIIFALMKITTRSLILSGCLLALLLPAPLRAQTEATPEIRAYQQVAGDRSALFRARQGERYDFNANGHPYWSTKEFRNGTIEFEGNCYYDVPLNIDALTQNALVRLSNAWLVTALPPAQVAFLDIEGHHYVGIGPDEEIIPEGFYEVFGEGPHKVYKHVSKHLQSSTIDANGDIIGYYDPDYKEGVLRHFAIQTDYYFRDSDGTFSRFKGKGALIRKFPARKRDIRRAINNSPYNLPGVNFDAFCEEVLRLADQ